MDEKTASATRMDKRSQGQNQSGPCSKLVSWFAACTVLVVVAVVMAMTMWTLVSHNQTMTSLQERLQYLETEVENSKNNIDKIVEEKVKTLFKEVRCFNNFAPAFFQMSPK